MIEQRYSDNNQSKRDIPSFIEPRPPLILHPFMRPRPQKGTNLMELYEDESVSEEPELVQVYLRLKPYHAQNNLYEVRSDRNLITSVDTATAGHGRRTQHNISKMYTFSHIFDSETTQKEIFEHVVKDNLKKLTDGHNFTLLTYGASGSGKTYTLMGTVASPGLVPRSLEYVFRVVDAAQQPVYKPSEGGADKLNNAEQDYELQWVKRLRQVSAPLRDKYRRMSAGLRNDFTASSLDLSNRTKHYVWVSFVEIYNEGIYDLLASSDRRSSSKLQIREDSSGNVFVKGVTQAFVRSGEEAYDVMVAGKHNLQVAATGVHAHSSRSHCIFTITMLTETEGVARTASVRLCDLAGCERARATRNAGARMQESRAINSSLHVLERCLHTLRRRQRHAGAAARAANTTKPLGVVPYRESKLTRLLGAGLSGARGEAVSMVVTLNPAPEYAHESRHVLQLAAVAGDIQVNNTIAETTLESSSQNSTITSSAEVMRLRADNERLHYELVRAQSSIKELYANMEERQQQAAATMQELVDDAKDMTRQYYEAQLAAQRSKMDDLIEEYESRLKAAVPANADSQLLEDKITELMTEIAILEENLTAEQLARARAEQEVQHLRACIDERDEKAFEDTNSEKREDVMVLSDSEHDSEEEDDDPCNESLEPTFKKEDINRSILIRKNLNSHNTSSDSTQNNNQFNKNDTIFEKSNDTLMEHEGSDASDETSKDSTCEAGDDSQSIQGAIDKSLNNTKTGQCDAERESNGLLNKLKTTDVRGTYCVQTFEEYKVGDINKEEKLLSHSKAPFCVNYDFEQLKNSAVPVIDTDVTENASITTKTEENEESIKKDNDVNIDMKKNDINEINSNRKVSQTLVNKIINSAKSTPGDNSLTQFEQLELATNTCIETKQVGKYLTNIRILNEKRTYFDEQPVINENKNKEESNTKPGNTYDLNSKLVLGKHVNIDHIDDNINHNSDCDIKKNPELLNDNNNLLRSPSIVKDEIITDNLKPNTFKKLLGESLTRPTDLASAHKSIALTKKHDSVDIFEGYDSPQQFNKEIDVIENARKSIEKLVLAQKSASKTQQNVKKVDKLLTNTKIVSPIKDSRPSISNKIPTILDNPLNKMGMVEDNLNIQQGSTISNNTIEDFDNIFKDITAPRPTEFDLLLHQETNVTGMVDNEKIMTHKIDKLTMNEIKIEAQKPTEVEDVKYNLRNKASMKSESLKVSNTNIKDVETDEVLFESQAKCESKTKPKRNLRLRRRKNQNEEEKSDSDSANLKDIVNLQEEFSDVTLDIPPPVKIVKDIHSPEKCKFEDENRPPVLEIQSCPSKSVTRSRRKLFTPRVEPLEESVGPAGDSNERIYVPRPSYHRARARRKL
ncbi:kinesin-like protein KIF20B [Achroia grisella]|uniref:kinesin-like protein KIF20B n=1 Tax=Achroia grisella TaxID=688607 RepID=UPI0027D2A1FE|nr:kinesin-like protein KIF20B [Achroia grisella]